jgi:hypothetical protein
MIGHVGGCPLGWTVMTSQTINGLENALHRDLIGIKKMQEWTDSRRAIGQKWPNFATAHLPR